MDVGGRVPQWFACIFGNFVPLVQSVPQIYETVHRSADLRWNHVEQEIPRTELNILLAVDRQCWPKSKSALRGYLRLVLGGGWCYSVLLDRGGRGCSRVCFPAESFELDPLFRRVW